MARILLVASYEWSRSYHAYQLADREHLVRSTDFTPHLAEVATSFRPDVIVAHITDEHAPADLFWQTVKKLREPRPAVVFSTDANNWGAVHVSPYGGYAMESPKPETLTKIVENVLYRQGLENPPVVPGSQRPMKG
ncbi:MAG: hypothetical protein KKC30_00830 [Proteobacteria bacterium]|nr:hypothetical protein [Pseudomonadota bacterium]MBU4275263.1 hypothetical protein [Pseudomonadota bacterium]MBU4382540.1 hypothetical protein [Pseudomonadota bacterium]MBU4606108.1 hypothetical protein [Pseudomonadota bacterium]MCG2765057.1 hypothetical protein [Desulfarculaceae bacterium]